jgi:type 1 glutamine amidotransferase
MRNPIRLNAFAWLLPALLATLALRADEDPFPTGKRVLFFTKSADFEHTVIKDAAKSAAPRLGEPIPGLAFQVVRALGEKNRIEFVCSKDGSLFSASYLAQFDAFLFFTTGDLTKAGHDGAPPMTPAGKAALLAAVAGGKGFIGVHSASDTFHSPGNLAAGPSRFQDDGDRADDYIKMIGGEFIQHGRQQPSHLIVADPKFPGASAVPTDARLLEEWYSLKNFSPDLHVVLVQETAGMAGPEYARPNYPSTWARMHGRGRVFYTNLGHRDDVWQGALFQSVLMGGVNWALGRVDADLTPNLGLVAPGAQVLPPYVPPPPQRN